MEEKEQNLLDNQEQDNNIKNIDEKAPLKNNEILNSIIIDIKKTLNESDNNKEDENNKDDNEGDEKEEYPIKVILEREQKSVTIIKSKLQTPWTQHYKEEKRCLNFLFYIILPFLVSLNLIGIFQIISVMNALSTALLKTLFNPFLIFLGLEDKEDKSIYDFYNFYSFYFKESINGGIEFDLIETMSFLGMVFYNFYGYKISSILFMILNGLSFFLIYKLFSEYNDSSESYNLTETLYLFGSWILLFIGVGCSALLSQQMLTDNFEKYNSFLKQVNNEDNQNNNNFIFICVTSIIGSLIKYMLDILFSYKKYKFDQNYNITDFYDNNNNITINNNTHNEINNIIFSHDKYLFFVSTIPIYSSTIILSIIFYYIFQCAVYKDNDESEIEILGEDDALIKFGQETGGFKDIYKPKDGEAAENELKTICKFFGYIFYINKHKKDNDNQKNNFDKIKCENNKERKSDDQINNDDSLRPEDEKEVNKKTTVTVVVNNGAPKIDYLKNKNKKLNCLYKTCKIISECICNIFFNLKILSYSLKSCINEIICFKICCDKSKNICPFCLCCECCLCCCDKCIRKIECCNKYIRQVKNEDYNLNEKYFFFCYKSERNLKWFDSFIKDKAQFKFMPLLVEFFLIQLNTIVFDIKVEEKNEDEEGYIEFIYSNKLLFILSLIVISILFFGLTFCFGLLRMYLVNISTNNSKKCCNFKCSDVSNIILNGTIGIVIFNSFYSLIAFYYLSKSWEHNFLFYIPILMNKFYYFVFSNHCTVYTDSEERIDYFSSATLLSIYLFIWDKFFNLIKKLPIKFLLFAQISLSLIIITIFILSLSILMISYKRGNPNNCCAKFIYNKFNKIEEENIENENNINIDISERYKCKKAIKFYNFPPLIGLKNESNLNYINSILQCLSQTKPLTNYFLRKSIEDLNGNIAKEYFKLIQKLWSKNIISSSISSNDFIKIIEERNSSFKSGLPGYYKEFIIFILDNIHNDLKKNKNKNFNNEQLNEYDQKNAFNHYYNEFMKECSVISDIFIGTFEKKGICSKFLNNYFSKGIPISYKYEKFNTLIFPLEKINNYKNQLLLGRQEKRNVVTLDDCFKYSQKESLNNCDYCKEFDLKESSNIYIAPNILIIILDRGKDILSDIKFEFEETIDITQFVIKKEKDEDKMIYNLYAVLTHNYQNHFVSYCKSPVNKNWYKFDDDKVNINEGFAKRVINFINPDILFYQKK